MSEKFAERLLDHEKIDIATFAEYITLFAHIVTRHKRSHFKINCSSVLLSKLMTVAEEAFCLLVMENCFNRWKWVAENNPSVESSANREHSDRNTDRVISTRRNASLSNNSVVSDYNYEKNK